MRDEEDEDYEEGWSIPGPEIGMRLPARPLTALEPDWSSPEIVEWDNEVKQLEKEERENNFRVFGGPRAPRALRGGELDEDELDEDEDRGELITRPQGVRLGKRGAPMSDENRDLPYETDLPYPEGWPNHDPAEWPEGYASGFQHVSIKGAARLANKSTDSIRRAIRSGKLKAEKIEDGRYVIREDELLKVFPQQPDGIKGTPPAYAVELVALQTELSEARAARETSLVLITTQRARIDELEADKAQLSRAFEVISDTLASQNRRGRPLMLEAEPRKRRLWRRGGN